MRRKKARELAAVAGFPGGSPRHKSRDDARSECVNGLEERTLATRRR